MSSKKPAARKGGKITKKAVSRSARAGLQFTVGRIHTNLQLSLIHI